MPVTYTQHLEEELRRVDEELRTGPWLPPRPAPPPLMVDYSMQLISDVNWRANVKRAQEEWPTRQADLRARRRRLEAELRRRTSPSV
jgi:hypothetical protein